MKIIIKPEIMARLLAYAVATQMEYSGFGFCDRVDGNIVMYDFVLLNVGSYGYTEIPPRLLLPLYEREDRKKMKIWLHRHPVGNGVPGPHNWSSRDELTIRAEPLGSTPQMVDWSVSVVLTPKGFVGRIDNYINGKTMHLEVEPNTLDFFNELASLEAACSPATSSGKRKRKSRSSEEDIPAPESHKKISFLGRKRKTRMQEHPAKPTSETTKKKSKKEEPMNPLEAQRLMRLYGDFAGNTIQLLQPLPTSAPTTELTGVGSETVGTAPVPDTTNNQVI